MRPKYVSLGLALCAATLVAALLLGNAPTHAQSGQNTPTLYPTPTGNGGNAIWTVAARMFESQYPDGFTFEIEVSSTGGRLTSAAVVWRYSPVSTWTRRPANLDDAGTRASTDWEVRLGDELPPWTSVEYFWVLTDQAGNAYQTDRKVVEYEDDSRSWKHIESDDIAIYWEEGVPDEIGRMALDAMREQREFYLKNWGKLLPYRPRAIIFAGLESWREWNPRAVTRGAIGLTSQNWGGTAQVYVPELGLDDLAAGTILHEVAHLYQNANGYTFREAWFYEGNATFFERHQMYDYLENARKMARAGNLPSLQGGGPSLEAPGGRRTAYDVGYAFWVWLTETFGEDAHLRVWTLLGQGRTGRDALKAVTGMGFIDMETAFRTWLGAVNPIAPTLVPSPPFVFPPTPTYEPSPVG